MHVRDFNAATHLRHMHKRLVQRDHNIPWQAFDHGDSNVIDIILGLAGNALRTYLCAPTLHQISMGEAAESIRKIEAPRPFAATTNRAVFPAAHRRLKPFGIAILLDNWQLEDDQRQEEWCCHICSNRHGRYGAPA